MSIAHLFPDLHPAFTPQEAIVEANRCLYCYDAPCAAACPTHIDVPSFIKKIATQNLRGSAITILEANLLGASCSRVCPVDILCEGACVMHRYNREPIQIGRLQRRAMDAFHESGDKLPQFPQPAHQLRVACIGAGPASLSCAGELARRGHLVTIYESRPLPGGLNTYGVAEYKLRTPDALKEVAFIESLGVEILCNEDVDERRLQQIADENDAVFLGLGLGRMDPLGIEGEDQPGVIDALRFIAGYKTASHIAAGRKVVVIGAGNTAIDAASAARRLGAEDVIMLYRRTAAGNVSLRLRVRTRQTRRRRVPLESKAGPHRLGKGQSQPASNACAWRMTNSSPSLRPGNPAIGQSKNTDLLIAAETNPKIFAGGDLTQRGREVVDAVADGKRAALAIHQKFGATHA